MQLEGGGKHSPGPVNYLFLKCEGHKMVSVDHMKGWIQKEGIKIGGWEVVKGTGKGETANERLRQVAAEGQFGLTDRAAENFSPNYKALLAEIGITANTTTVQRAMGEIFDRLRTTIDADLPMLKANLQQALARVGTTRMPSANDIATMPNALLSKFISQLLVPMSSALTSGFGAFRKSETPFVAKFRAAQHDLLRIATRLESDARHTGLDFSERVSEEIRVSQDALDASLVSFMKQLQ